MQNTDLNWNRSGLDIGHTNRTNTKLTPDRITNDYITLNGPNLVCVESVRSWFRGVTGTYMGAVQMDKLTVFSDSFDISVIFVAWVNLQDWWTKLKHKLKLGEWESNVVGKNVVVSFNQFYVAQKMLTI